MNNKGFAITGILYTLLILFLLIIGSFLGGLKAKNNYLERTIISYDNKYMGVEVMETNNNIAEYTGKYIFSNGDINCYSYLNKGDVIDVNNIKFTSNECNNIVDKSRFLLNLVYEFEGVS